MRFAKCNDLEDNKYDDKNVNYDGSNNQMDDENRNADYSNDY